MKYPANKFIDRLLHKKRSGAQLAANERNVLWLDLKHGLSMRAVDCLPFRSEVSKGSCFIGSIGIWHAFYGHVGARHLPERAVLEWPCRHEAYEQQLDGWFRAMPKASAAVLSVSDGVLVFENPWAALPLDDARRTEMVRLREFRPEFSWFGPPETLQRDVDSELRTIAWLIGLAENGGAETSQDA